LDVLYNIGKQHIPVIKGSSELIYGKSHLAEFMHGTNGLGDVELPHSPEKAIVENNFETIYKMVMTQPHQITWANTGALTNLCLLLRKFPDILTKIKQFVLMAGSAGRGNITPAAEFNVFFDPYALDEVLKLKKDVPLVMIGLDTTM
jgi:inosine-uridine nucleoside N-ribohydrolase